MPNWSLNRLLVLLAGLLLSHSVNASPIDLGQAADYTILAAGTVSISSGGGTLTLGSEAHVFGSAGGRGFVQAAGGVQIDENLTGGSFSLSPDIVVGNAPQTQLSPADWNIIYQGMVTASAEASGLPDQTIINQIVSSTSLGVAGSGLSAYHVQGQFLLGSADTLTITGGASDRVVVNVDGGMDLASGAAIVMSGGIQPQNVLFNFTGGGYAQAVQIGAANFSGIYLGPKMFFSIGDGATMTATQVLGSGISGNIQDMTPPIPEPNTAVLVGLGLLGLAARSRTRARAPSA